MNASATEEFRVRIDRKLAHETRRVAAQIDTTPGDVVRLLFAQMVKLRSIPFPLQADGPEAKILGSAERRARIRGAMNEGIPAAR